MNRQLLSAMLLLVLLAGCGGGESKMADVPTEEMIAADEAEQKVIEAEERGTPIKAGKRR